MKFLHTSDWHVGRAINSISRDTEHEAALRQVLTHAIDQAVDCVLIAGDIFDTSAPTPESERMVYGFFKELHGVGIPAAIIAGNHDHPRRFEAIAPLLQTMGIHSRGTYKDFAEGGVVEVTSKDGRESAVIATVPWIPERGLVDVDDLQAGADVARMAYAERVPHYMSMLAEAFRPDAVNILMSHAFVTDSVVGQGGGERTLTLSDIYGIPRQRLPQSAQYIALGHVHKAQELVKSPAAWYSGSLLQLDFGEVDQVKSVNLVEIHPRQPSSITKLAIDKGTRQLIDVGRIGGGVKLNELAAYVDQVGDAWLRVFIDLDLPVANLWSLVRETLPNAVHVLRSKPSAAAIAATAEPVRTSTPEEMFTTFYRSTLGKAMEPTAATMTMFRRLLEEEADAAPDA